MLRKRSFHDSSRNDLLEIVGRIERHGAPSVAEKVRTWMNQLFRYALVIVPGLERNPASSLDVVAMQPPPARHNPFLRMPKLPEFLRLLRKCPGRLQTQLGARMLLLTGVRIGELRLVTPSQRHVDDGLWIIPPDVLKQLKLKVQKENLRTDDIPPYIVPLPVQAVEIVQHMLDPMTPAQKYQFPAAKDLKRRISENTLNHAPKGAHSTQTQKRPFIADSVRRNAADFQLFQVQQRAKNAQRTRSPKGLLRLLPGSQTDNGVLGSVLIHASQTMVQAT